MTPAPPGYSPAEVHDSAAKVERAGSQVVELTTFFPSLTLQVVFNLAAMDAPVLSVDGEYFGWRERVAGFRVTREGQLLAEELETATGMPIAELAALTKKWLPK